MLNEQELLAALDLGETRDREFKSAKGGVPGSLWETYSAMANTDGGCIVLGVEERDETFHAHGLDDVGKAKKNIWDALNNRNKASQNLLLEDDVASAEIEGKTVLVIRVPRATRRQRPIFIGLNPLTGTYRRNYEGDYLCNQQEVGRMLADQAEESADSQILEGFTLNDLDPTTLQQYRQRFSARAPEHPWLTEDTLGLLTKLGAWRQDRRTNLGGPTVAGLLMFGKEEAIHDPAAIPGYNLDYRERLSSEPSVRWTDRLTLDGTWPGNLFQFYQRVFQRLTQDLKVPFRLGDDLFRKDETEVHEAIREALVNALVHADYRGVGGVVIERDRSRIEMSNPGSLLLPLEQIVRGGGLSECRNSSLQRMFFMIGGGEKAGSGIDKIRSGWKSQNWRLPSIEEATQPERVRVTLPMVSYLPDESLERLRKQFRDALDSLTPIERHILVTADIEQEVSNTRMQLVTDHHPTDLGRMLQRLVAKGFLERNGHGRGARYRLARLVEDPPHKDANLVHKDADLVHKDADLVHKDADLVHKDADLVHKDADSEEWQLLRALAEPVAHSQRLPSARIRSMVLELCSGRYLTAAQIAELMHRNTRAFRKQFLAPMIQEGLLTFRYPNDPKRPDQAYTSKTVGPGQLSLL